MVTNNGLMRIFWPSDTPTKPTAGVLVGWRNSELDIFVVTVLRDVEVRSEHHGIERPHAHPFVAKGSR